jgi:hypothetical protein
MLRKMILILALIGAAPAAAADTDDAAHRIDRARTRQLNHAAGSVVDSHNRKNAEAQARYRAQRSDYQRRMEAWRDRVAACRGGNFAACDDR